MKINKQFLKVSLFIEQKMEKLASYCDRILLLHEGKQIAFDTPEKIFSRSDLADLGICPPYATRYCKEQNILRIAHYIECREGYDRMLL